MDFQYGDWLRRDFEDGSLRPWSDPNPDLAVLLTIVRRDGRALAGPPPEALVDPVPRDDLHRAMLDELSEVTALESDVRNDLLTLARIWMTLDTGSIEPKDVAAGWALERLPEDLRAPLAHARDAYVGRAPESWDEHGPTLRRLGDQMIASIERSAAAAGRDAQARVVIARERPDSADAAELILELEAHLAPQYPAESRHGFSVERLLAEGVDFFVLRADGEPAGCGGILFVDDMYGEVKRMYVRPSYRGLGFGRRILDRLAEHARSRGIGLLRLETGIHQRDAIALYERFGFRRIGPFGPYLDDPLSRYFELRLGPD
jgi:ribosomal protein S18 acetylase RimI-like enzyme